MFKQKMQGMRGNNGKRGLNKMRIAVSSKGKTLESEIDEVFGRCKYFIIAEANNNDMRITEVIENVGMKLTGGAGITSARTIAGKNVDVLIAGNVGPKAMDVLKQFNVKIHKAEGKVKNAIKNLMER